MEPANNYLDELVRKAFPDEDTSSNDAALWDRIDKTMRYKGFLRFSLSHFNIYYSVLIILLISSAVYFILNNSNPQNFVCSKNNSAQIIVPTAKDSVQREAKNENLTEASVSSVQQLV